MMISYSPAYPGAGYTAAKNLEAQKQRHERKLREFLEEAEKIRLMVR